MGFESTNQMADVANKIQKYIQEIVSTTVASKKDCRMGGHWPQRLGSKPTTTSSMR
jgi:hypothetical protein